VRLRLYPTHSELHENKEMRWTTKARIFRALELLPFKNLVHYQLQRHLTRQWPRPPGHLDELLDAAKRLVAAVGTQGGKLGSFVEIGAGRDLATAVAARLLGVERVTCVDVSRLAKPELIGHAAMHLAHRIGVSDPMIRTWDDVAAFGITYCAPFRLQDVSFSGQGFDVFFSVDTLEHIPADELAEVLAAGQRLLTSEGLQIHFVDYSDHYARGGGVSRFNFLTYDDAAWRPFNTSFQYVNRLRHSQFLQTFADLGLPLRLAQPEVAPVEEDVVSKLAPQFQRFGLQDLFTLRAMLIA